MDRAGLDLVGAEGARDEALLEAHAERAEGPVARADPRQQVGQFARAFERLPRLPLPRGRPLGSGGGRRRGEEGRKGKRSKDFRVGHGCRLRAMRDEAGYLG
ncbi:MAG: hypothetical protein Kow0062_27220 [Acidobacteriota bacterium]